MTVARHRRPSPAVRRRRRIVAFGGGAVLVAGIALGTILFALAGRTDAPGPALAATSTALPSPPAEEPVVAPAVESTTEVPIAPAASEDGFDRSQFSLTDPASHWVIVNKIHPLAGAETYTPALVAPADWIPNPNGHDLQPDAAAALATMFQAAADEAGLELIAQSGYRSYESQISAFAYYSDLLGVADAEKTSARPGFSEHQTGFAVDILDTASGCDLEGPCFGSSAAGQWLAANAHRFGFLLRYPADKTEVTGYEYEPWHFRWVGVPLSEQMATDGVTTLEEFFGVAGSTEYR